MSNPEYADRVPGSFRDPSGYLLRQNGQLYRQVNNVYKKHYDLLINSGLYQSLVDAKLLIPHEEVDSKHLKSGDAYKLLKPEPIEFISYPYEWCFSQLKDAALTTIKVQKEALKCGMTLKDANAYNIQFHRGEPIFIDTLSFERYIEGRPWVAYRQFCQHFLAPLALMSYRDIRLNQLMRIYINGVPLDLASSLLPARTRFSLPLLVHLHLHARSQAHYADRKADVKGLKLSLRSLHGIIDQLEGIVKGLTWRPSGTEWAAYYNDNNYSVEAFGHKKEIVADFLSSLNPGIVWDVGANTGIFSRIASNMRIQTIAFDMDPAAVEINYLNCVKEREIHILPLVGDIASPSPRLGWENSERMSLVERGPADTILALALVHHLVISNNIPLDRIAGFFSNIGKSLVIEFVPKTDSQVMHMLSSREDIFTDYAKPDFEHAFARYFAITDSVSIRDSERTLYLMRARET